MTYAAGRRLVAIDSNVLVWGIRRQGTQTQRQRAGWLFAMLEEDQAQVIVPSIALAEYLTPVPPAQHEAVIGALTTRLLVLPFDVRCAALSARLFSEGKGLREMKKEGARKTLRADCLIIATAFVHGARTFYSGDAGCRKLASRVRGLQAEDVPSVAPSLFDLEQNEP